MTAVGFALFETEAGICAIAWNARGIAGVQLPERDAASMRQRMVFRFRGALEARPPAHVQSAIDAIVALLRGDRVDLSSITLDMSQLEPFTRRVYQIARQIPLGQTLSYGEVAARLGMPRAARAVGQALGRNPFPLVVPCHRVLAAGGAIGGFTAPGGLDTKRQLLAIEGVSCVKAEREPRAGRAPRGSARLFGL